MTLTINKESITQIRNRELVPQVRSNQSAGIYNRLVCVALYLGGVGLLARSYTVPPNSFDAYGLFWAGLLTAYCATVLIAWLPGARPLYYVSALALLGGMLFLPTYLRSPDFPIFTDELFHIQSIESMQLLKTSQLPVTFYPIPGDYPGLEFMGLALHYASGIPIEIVGRLTPLIIHILIPVVVFYTLVSCSLSYSLAFIGSLVYMSNSSYYFFHSIFSYETLSMLLFLLVMLLGFRQVKVLSSNEKQNSLSLFITIAALIFTHHISSLIALGFLLTLGGAAYIVYQKIHRAIFAAVLFGSVLWLTWIFFLATRSINYLGSAFIARLQTVAALFKPTQTGAKRELFKNSSLPVAERLLAYFYILLLLGLILLGLWVVFRSYKATRKSNLHLLTCQLTLFIFGPLTWLGLGPLILTRSSDIVYRAWPFIFLGIGFYAAHAINQLLQIKFTLKNLPRCLTKYITAPIIVVLGLLLAGGIIVGDNQSSRFRPAEIQAAAGPEALTNDLVEAARWLNNEAGSYNRITGDVSSSTAFAVFGNQFTNIWSSWIPYYTLDKTKAQVYLNEYKINFVAVDLRDSRYPPRYGQYFSGIGVSSPIEAINMNDKILPIENLAKFDSMEKLQRIFDNGDVILYANIKNK